jgi:hypothetical protein
VKVLRLVVWTFLFLIVLVFLLPMFGPGTLMATGSLLLGWFAFLKRVVPEVAISWSGVGMVILCSALVIAGLHSLCSWIFAHNRTGGESVKWRWQWSASIYAGAWVLFLAAMGITGFAHQLIWLAASDEPLLVERRGSIVARVQLRNTTVSLADAANDSAWEFAAAREAFFSEAVPGLRKGDSAIDKFHILFLPGTQATLRAAIVFHRDPKLQRAAGFLVVRNGDSGSPEEHRMEDLPEVLAQLQSQ